MKASNLVSGGFRSRKLLFALFALLLVFLGGLLAAQSAALASLYQIMVSGIEAITAIYLIGNVGSKYAGLKAGAKPESKEAEDQ